MGNMKTIALVIASVLALVALLVRFGMLEVFAGQAVWFALAAFLVVAVPYAMDRR
ncbi:MAG: hypothetical protein JWR75_852 [Devosia sp.]|nr:hypothetical protein [Devosia sp.]